MACNHESEAAAERHCCEGWLQLVRSRWKQMLLLVLVGGWSCRNLQPELPPQCPFGIPIDASIESVENRSSIVPEISGNWSFALGNVSQHGHDDSSTRHHGKPAGMEDGCGIVSSEDRVKWRPRDEEEEDFMNQVSTCVREIPCGTFSEPDPDASLNVMACDVRVTPSLLLETLQKYDRVFFIGDSILRQQMSVLYCSLQVAMGNSSAFQVHQYAFTKGGKYPMHFSYNTNNKKDADKKEIIGISAGWLFDKHHRAFYKTFPRALLKSTERDAFVLSVNAHYDEERMDEMEHLVTFIHHKVLTTATNASVYVMEPTNMEWPTSNGMYGDLCWNKCSCEPLTPERLNGMGTTFSESTNTSRTPNKKKARNNNHQRRPGAAATLPLHIQRIVRRLYPALNMAARKKDNRCFPSCVPGTWRSDMARSVFQPPFGNPQQRRQVHLVPSFWQFVALGQVTSRTKRDCTHKSLSAVLVLNNQLVRTMRMAQTKEPTK